MLLFDSGKGRIGDDDPLRPSCGILFLLPREDRADFVVVPVLVVVAGDCSYTSVLTGELSSVYELLARRALGGGAGRDAYPEVDMETVETEPVVEHTRVGPATAAAVMVLLLFSSIEKSGAVD